MVKFEIGDRVKVKETSLTLEHEEMYPGETGTVTGYEGTGFPRVRIDNVREDDEIGLALIADDGGWLYKVDELEPFEG